MAGRPIRRARLAEAERRRQAIPTRKDRDGMILKVGGMVLLTIVLLLWYLTWATAHLLLWCGRNLASKMDMEDLLDRIPGPR